MEFTSDIFISYNRKDENFVEFLTKVFEKYEIKYFLDKSDLKLYDKLDSNLKKNVSSSRYLLSLISPAYLSSYWCLFEAIEAIQLQDISLKYLPVFLRYKHDDPFFNEDYLIERLSELNSEIELFEHKMIINKAYELSGKIDKLNFIKANLPKIFNQTQINIYPVFELYNHKTVIANLESLLNYIRPELNVKLNSMELTFDSNVDYQYTKPVINSLPQIKWSVYIGKMKSKNLPLILGNDIFIGTCGIAKNEPDEKDGIYCIDFLSGKVKWFTQTSNDVNSGIYRNGILLYGCIDGSLYCLSSKHGAIKWNINLGSAIFSKPFFVNDTSLIEQIFVTTYEGEIFLINIHDGSIEKAWSLKHKVRSDVLITKEPDLNGYTESYMYFSCEDGFLFKIKFEFSDVQLKIVWGKQFEYPDEFSNSGYSRCVFYSSPVEHNNCLIQLFSRQTYYPYPAILSINITDGSIKWIAQNNNKEEGGSGNLRTQPIILQDDIIFADAYSNSIKCVSFETGNFRWKIESGRYSFEQWSSPVVYKGYVYMAKHDGHVSKINISSKKKEWSLYLGEHNDAGTVIEAEQANIEAEQVWWEIKKGYPIYATPVISKNHMMIGTDEGYLYCISNIT